MLKSLHFRLAATTVAGLLAVTLVNCALFSYRLSELDKDLPVMEIVLTTAGVSLLVVLCVAGILALVLRKNLLNPLESLATLVARVEQGDLDARTEGTYIGRLEVLRNGLENMLVSLQKEMAHARKHADEARVHAAKADEALWTAQRASRHDQARREGMLGAGETLESVTETIRAATTDLRKEADKVSEGAADQQDRVAETAVAMDQMLTTIQEVAENASNASTAAENTMDQARSGAAVVDKSVEAIGLVSSQTQQLKERMADLGGKAESIGAVMNVISDIADQTNLLALNAAIEAARAGDAGRGFAVVADEVRKLAEKTMTATNEVGQAIDSIQQGTRDSIANMEEAAKAVAKATELAHDSGNALGEIVSLADSTSTQIQSIAAAAEEQAVSSERIKSAIESVRDVSDRTTSGMQRAGETIRKLGDQIEELIKLNGVFKLIGQGEAQEAVEALAMRQDISGLAPNVMERAMRDAIAAHTFFELLYATDAEGIQVTENIAPSGFPKSGESVRGRNWSKRPWFTGVKRNGDTYISPIYMSEASKEYCMTISTPILHGHNIVGVLAADIKVFG